jgi:hypothetical protein
VQKQRLSLPAKINIKLVIPLILSFLFVFSLFYSLFFTKKTINSLVNKNFSQANQSANKAIFFPKTLSKITLNKSDTLKAWQTTLELTPLVTDLSYDLDYVSKNLLNPGQPQANLIIIEEKLLIINAKALVLQDSLHSSFILKNISVTDQLDDALKISDQILLSLNTINKKNHTFLILLQNTEELRASGGFMGSYARVDINEGKIINITIQDIYEPDGQFTGFVDAPYGAKQYLSGGDGLRLPDSNWHPDFPTAAKTISSYFAFGDERKIDSIITLNVDFVEKILKIVGDIYLPDYGLTVTADNLTALARADRNSFFAGSKQKANFLTTLFNNLKIKLTQLNTDQQEQIANTLLTGLTHKDLQLFSWHPQLQDIFTNYNVAGEIEYRDQNSFYLYLPETNVGINKANKKITREVKVNLGQNRTDLVINFHNDDAQSELDYINYQRLILNPRVTIKQIEYDKKPIDFYEDIISNSDGSDFKQVGFILPLESGLSKTLMVTLTHQPICATQVCKIQIQKQSGLPPTPYQISFENIIKNIVLEKDEIISF